MNTNLYLRARAAGPASAAGPGPRPVGKPTVASPVEERLGWPRVVASAGAALPPPPEWLEARWRLPRAQASSVPPRVFLVLDEIQKARAWSEVIRRLWDAERERAQEAGA